jgi:anti-sigma regulatory factor (Ser/Thr protein kinase)
MAVSAAEPASTAVPLDDRSRVGEARRIAASVAARAGLSEGTRSDVGIAATELATNVVRHAGKGTLLVRQLEGAGGGIELLCVDAGPGMRDPAACMADGFSTAGSMGTGLGAIRRLAHGFDLYTMPSQGTVVVARFWARRDQTEGRAAGMLAGLAVAMAGEAECGDGWAARSGSAGTTVLLADGLGHGGGDLPRPSVCGAGRSGDPDARGDAEHARCRGRHRGQRAHRRGWDQVRGGRQSERSPGAGPGQPESHVAQRYGGDAGA